MEAEHTVDATGKVCPLPILELAKALKGAEVGEVVLLLATDPAVEPDLRAFCSATGHLLLELESEGRLCRAFIRKQGR